MKDYYKRFICITFISSLLYRLHELSIYGFIGKIIILLSVYNINIFLLIYICLILTKNSNRLCIICNSNPRNIITRCDRCHNMICGSCYMNISERTLINNGYKYRCPFCRREEHCNISLFWLSFYLPEGHDKMLSKIYLLKNIEKARNEERIFLKNCLIYLHIFI